MSSVPNSEQLDYFLRLPLTNEQRRVVFPQLLSDKDRQKIGEPTYKGAAAEDVDEEEKHQE